MRNVCGLKPYSALAYISCTSPLTHVFGQVIHLHRIYCQQQLGFKMHQLTPDLPILVTGSSGVVGQALVNGLKAMGMSQVIEHSSTTCDMTNAAQTNAFFEQHKPKLVFHLAARVYGIIGNMRNHGTSFYDNIMINTNVIEACRVHGVEKIVAMGTGAVYPDFGGEHLLKEDEIWQGRPHPSEEYYAHAKRAMLAQLEAYKAQYGMRSSFVISGNLYGPHDRFDEVNGHVVPSLISKFDRAAKAGERVTVWGNGAAQRDFLYADDAAQALIHIAQKVDGPINMASGNINAIRDVVETLAKLYYMEDKLDWDANMPNGQAFRAYNVGMLYETGFRPAYDLHSGLAKTVEWYKANRNSVRR